MIEAIQQTGALVMALGFILGLMPIDPPGWVIKVVYVMVYGGSAVAAVATLIRIWY